MDMGGASVALDGRRTHAGFFNTAGVRPRFGLAVWATTTGTGVFFVTADARADGMAAEGVMGSANGFVTETPAEQRT